MVFFAFSFLGTFLEHQKKQQKNTDIDFCNTFPTFAMFWLPRGPLATPSALQVAPWVLPGGPLGPPGCPKLPPGCPKLPLGCPKGLPQGPTDLKKEPFGSPSPPQPTNPSTPLRCKTGPAECAERLNNNNNNNNNNINSIVVVVNMTESLRAFRRPGFVAKWRRRVSGSRGRGVPKGPPGRTQGAP